MVRHRIHPPRAEREPKHRPKEVVDEYGRPYIQTIGKSEGSHLPWTPGPFTAFKLVLSARLSAAFWSFITDCDETYNYWEPAHFLIYGSGFQTWEYSPTYSLRSYLYILSHAFPGWVYAQILQPNKMYVFYFIRCLLAVVCSMCEVYFFKGVCREIGANVGRLTLALLTLSAGMFISSTAFLPSSTSMYLLMVSYGGWFNQQYKLAIFATALSTFVSWPFAGALGIPIAIDVLFRKREIKLFVLWCLISFGTIVPLQLFIDREYYGKLVWAPLNIVLYNVFTNHGPDLYGTEPWNFYFLNGFLNFNWVFVAALLVWPLQLIIRGVLPQPETAHKYLPNWLTHFGLHLWLSIFLLQPHKEERFLYPIYPLICLAGAAAIDCVQKLYFYVIVRSKTRHYLDHTNFLSVFGLIVYGIVSMMRITALYQNYHAPMDIWMHVNHLPHTHTEYASPTANVTVCLGKEWHRFPTSFFVPSDRWSVEFLRSEFRGQLPRHFEAGANATKLIVDGFNDQNKEEMDRYRVSPEECDFLVDVEWNNRVTELEPRYSEKDNWQVEYSYAFLDSFADSGKAGRVLRAFHVPFVSPLYCEYGNYVLLRNTKPAKRNEQKQKLKKKIRHL